MIPMLCDYATLKLIWWGLGGLLLILFALTDGIDFGIGMVLPFIAKNDLERRSVINVIGPHWEGNQVWLLSLGGAIFAAWPIVYSTVFSLLYLALLLLLWGLFFRPVAFDFRSKIANPKWRQSWDWAMFVGSLVPSLVFGVAVGNLFLGLPFSFDANMNIQAQGVFWGLFSPWTLGCGLLSILMFLLIGLLYLQLKADPVIAQRGFKIQFVVAILWVALYWLLGLKLRSLAGYQLVDNFAHQDLMLPLSKQVLVLKGAWLNNFENYPILWILPRLGLVGPLVAVWLSSRNRKGSALVVGCIAALAMIASFGISLFPFLVPSQLNPDHSLTIWDAASGPQSLNMLLLFAGFFIPLISIYTVWVYKKMWKKVQISDVQNNSQTLY